MTSILWVPGRFSLTNKMLDNLRAAEKYHGRRPKGWVDLFAQETRAIRLAVKAAAKRSPPGAPPAGFVCNVRFIVFGHRKYDPDAWYLLGKAALDGLVDAKVFSSDRFRVWTTGGRVLRNADEEKFVVSGFGGHLFEIGGRIASVVPEKPGLAIELIWWKGRI